MAKPVYMKVSIHNIPQATIDYYNLTPLIYKGDVNMISNMRMYGLPQGGRLANDLLLKFLLAAGSSQWD